MLRKLKWWCIMRLALVRTRRWVCRDKHKWLYHKLADLQAWLEQRS